MLDILSNSVVVAPCHHQVNTCCLARREAAPQGGQSLQGQAQILLSLISVQREKQAGGPLRKQPFQALCFSGRLVKGTCVEGGIQDVCLDSIQTMKGLPEDACSELAVYENLEEAERD